MIVVLNSYSTFEIIVLIICDYFVILFNELQLFIQSRDAEFARTRQKRVNPSENR